MHHYHSSVAILAQAVAQALAPVPPMWGSWDAVSSDDDAPVVQAAVPAALVPAVPAALVPANGAALKLPPSDSPLEELITRRVATALPPPGVGTDFNRLAVPGVGTDVVQTVGRAVSSTADPRTSPYASLSQRFCGKDDSWSIPGRAVIAAILGKSSHTHVGASLQKLAAAQHFGARLWFESVLHHLLAAIERKELRLRATWTNFSSDSTTLQIGNVVWSSGPRDTDIVGGTAAYVPLDDPDVEEEVGPRARIHQSDWNVAFLLEKPDGTCTLLVIPIVVPLQVTDCGKAEVAYAAWAESVGSDILDSVLEKADVVYDLMSLDRDSANLRAHRSWTQLHNAAVCHRSMCYAHGSWTVSGGVFQSCEGMVSGVVAVGLSARPGSMWKLMKRTLEDLIFCSIQEVDADPPLPGSLGDIEVCRDAVLDTLLPDYAANKDQRCNLKSLIRSNIDSEWILLYKCGGVTNGEKRAFATRLAGELLPRRPGSLRRQRWLTTVKPVAQLGLLGGFFNLLERMLEHFYLRARGKKEHSMTPGGPRVVPQPFSDDEGEPAAGVRVEMPVMKDGTPDWSKWNKSQQRNVERFRQSRPTAALISMGVGMVPLADLSEHMIRIHTVGWDRDQRIKHAKGEPFRTIGMEFAAGDCFTEFKDKIHRLFWDEGEWKALSTQYRSYRTAGLVSGALGRELCGLEMQVISDSRRLPHALGQILVDEEAADRIVRTPPCMQELVSVCFLSRYATAELVRGGPAQMEVWTTNYTHPRCAMLLESRMACIRALCNQRQQTWKTNTLST